MENEKIFEMKLSKVYPLLVAKAERKSRAKEEVYQVTCWLAGYTAKQIDEQIMKEVDYKIFFEEAPEMNPNCNLITGNICGIKLQEIEDPLMRKIGYLDKVIDEKEFTQEDLNIWKKKRIKKVLRNFKSNMEIDENIDEKLLELKLKYSYEDIIKLLRTKLLFGKIGMKIASFLSFGKGRSSITVIYTDGVNAKQLAKK